MAFDLYGTLVDPIAISGELGRVLGDADGREAARLWRLKEAEYSFRLTGVGPFAGRPARLTSPSPPSGSACRTGRPSGSPGSMTTCSRSRTPSPRCGPWPAWGTN